MASRVSVETCAVQSAKSQIKIFNYLNNQQHLTWQKSLGSIPNMHLVRSWLKTFLTWRFCSIRHPAGHRLQNHAVVLLSRSSGDKQPLIHHLQQLCFFIRLWVVWWATCSSGIRLFFFSLIEELSFNGVQVKNDSGWRLDGWTSKIWHFSRNFKG